ncbi:MAG: hypothetical protein AAF539_13105, partial [Planctomycetota bacterium]
DAITHGNSLPDATQRLDIRTAEVGIDRRRIWTTQPIHMHVGDAVLVGRDLTLHLATGPSVTSARPGSDVTDALDRMELIYLRELTLPLGRPNADGSYPQRVEIRCGGTIDYDFALDELNLNRDVELLHFADSTKRSGKTPDGSEHGDANPWSTSSSSGSNHWTDRFQCESLSLTLREPMNANRTRDGVLDWIDRIIAEGTPVRANIGSQASELTAHRLMLDPIEGRLIAEPMLASESRKNIPVRIRHGNLTATLSQMTYQFDPSDPQRLGTLVVRGGGQLQDRAIDRVLDSLTWGNELKIEPQSDSNQSEATEFFIQCGGGLHGTLADGGRFEAGHVEGIVRGNDPAAMSQWDTRLSPDRIAASRDVRIASPMIDVQTEELYLFFEEQDAGTAANASTVSQQEPGRPNRGQTWIRQPKAVTNPVDEPTSQRPPAMLRGRQIAAKLRLDRGELVSSSLSVDGDVSVAYPLNLPIPRDDGSDSNNNASKHQRTDAPSNEMAILRGEQLIIRDGSATDVMELRAKPGQLARLDYGDGYFVGSEIRIRPDEDRIDIPGSGEFVIPRSMLPTAPESTTRWSRLPKCRFSEALTFDGRQAVLDGGVSVMGVLVQNGALNELSLNGETLTIFFDQPVSLQTRATSNPLSRPPERTDAQIEEVRIQSETSDGVTLQSLQFADDGQQTGRHRFRTRQLSWFPGETNQIVAPYAGSYNAWLQEGDGGFLGQSASPSDVADQQNQGAVHTSGLIEASLPGRGISASNSSSIPNSRASVSSKSLSGVHLVYEDRMQAQVDAQTLEFIGNVRVARQTVPDFATEIDAMSMNQLGIDQMTLDCQRLRLAINDAGGSSRTRVLGEASPIAWEMNAFNGVRFRNRTESGLIEAMASRCGYAAAKDLFTIDGIAGQPARMWQTDSMGRPGANLTLWSLTMRLKTLQVVDSQIAGFQMGTLPNELTRQ